MDMLDQNESIDPNINYNILETTLINALDKHIPFRRVKIHKHKHKKNKMDNFRYFEVHKI